MNDNYKHLKMLSVTVYALPSGTCDNQLINEMQRKQELYGHNKTCESLSVMYYDQKLSDHMAPQRSKRATYQLLFDRLIRFELLSVKLRHVCTFFSGH